MATSFMNVFVAFSLFLKQTKWMREIITQLLEDRHFSRSGEVELEIAGTRYVDLQNSLRSKDRRSIKAWLFKIEKKSFFKQDVYNSRIKIDHIMRKGMYNSAAICSLKFWPIQFVVTRSLCSDNISCHSYDKPDSRKPLLIIPGQVDSRE